MLINNVGDSLGMALSDNKDEAKFDKIVSVNLKSVYPSVEKTGHAAR